MRGTNHEEIPANLILSTALQTKFVERIYFQRHSFQFCIRSAKEHMYRMTRNYILPQKLGYLNMTVIVS